MIKLITLSFILISSNLFAQSESTLVGAWWFVNSNTVTVIEQISDKELVSKHCESEEYFTSQVCVEYGEVTLYNIVKSDNHACSHHHPKVGYCWYHIQTSSSSGPHETLYVRADARNTMPGVGYVLTAKRLTPGKWPMKN